MHFNLFRLSRHVLAYYITGLICFTSSASAWDTEITIGSWKVKTDKGSCLIELKGAPVRMNVLYSVVGRNALGRDLLVLNFEKGWRSLFYRWGRIPFGGDGSTAVALYVDDQFAGRFFITRDFTNSSSLEVSGEDGLSSGSEVERFTSEILRGNELLLRRLDNEKDLLEVSHEGTDLAFQSFWECAKSRN